MFDSINISTKTDTIIAFEIKGETDWRQIYECIEFPQVL